MHERARGGALAALLAGTLLTGCTTGTSESTPPVSAPPARSTAQPPPAPWTVADLTQHPCAVLDDADLARFVLDPGATRADTPPRSLPRCAWFSVQSSPTGRFTIGFTPRPTDSTDPARRAPGPAESSITIADRRAVLEPETRPDGRIGGCSVEVAVPSGGSFALGIVASGIATGVDWDVCAETIAVATGISARLR
ncbi:DUF3558 family protein [Nocardia jiangsuensis]|uniref:DUF3558 family protein n=1 Tax=Nocardia jiangsuensis TaxID=1691563 RepID=A0ABV8DLE8_9NOCA